MSLLAELLGDDASAPTVATPATVATQAANESPESQESQESQGLDAAIRSADLPDAVRTRIADTAVSLCLPWRAVLAQFESWSPYPPNDWQEMHGWSDETMQAHCRLLAWEVEQASPTITCAACRHFQPDTINPPDGMGLCALDAWQDSRPVPWAGNAMPPFPNARRHCQRFEARP